MVLILLNSCGGQSPVDSPIEPEILNQAVIASDSVSGQYIPWGYYDLEIARDGSSVEIIPNRTANVKWGFHLNVLKLLEVDPCSDCLSISNVHLLPDGDLSMDVSITHPFDLKEYTGFDVRGIIMFPSSQYLPDDDLRTAAGFGPYDPGYPNEHTHFLARWSSYEKGDAELINPDGWTMIWAPDFVKDFLWFDLAEGLPIFEYYPGIYSSGEEIGTVNAFIRFYSNETRHMFEAGATVTRTYLIRPPATGPIEACYAIYAHWAPPSVMPVMNPIVDFPLKANSPMPYESWITQEQVIDPDAPATVSAEFIHWHLKFWDPNAGPLIGDINNLPYFEGNGGLIKPHPEGQPDDYYLETFTVFVYTMIPGALPGEYAYLFRIEVRDPDNPNYPIPLGTDWIIKKIQIEAPDGTW